MLSSWRENQKTRIAFHVTSPHESARNGSRFDPTVKQRIWQYVFPQSTCFRKALLVVGEDGLDNCQITVLSGWGKIIPEYRYYQARDG